MWNRVSKWGPIAEERDQSMFFEDITYPNGTVVSARTIKLMRVRVKVSRDATYDYRLVLRDYNILDFKCAPPNDIMQGVDTPIFNKPAVPAMPSSGFLAALANAFAAVGRFLYNGLAAVWIRLINTLQGIYAWLMPYLTSMWTVFWNWLLTLPYIGTVSSS